MDPIAAFRVQRARNTDSNQDETTMAELRLAQPTWASYFEQVCTSPANQRVDLEQAIYGMNLIMNQEELPTYRMQSLFKERLSAEGRIPGSSLDFKSWVYWARDVKEYMIENRKWKKEEANLAEAEELRKQMEMREKFREAKQRERESPDVFAVLGIKKSKDMDDIEKRKNAACSKAVRRFSLAGQAVLSRTKTVGDDPDSACSKAVRRFSAGVLSRTKTVGDDPVDPMDASAVRSQRASGSDVPSRRMICPATMLMTSAASTPRGVTRVMLTTNRWSLVQPLHPELVVTTTFLEKR